MSDDFKEKIRTIGVMKPKYAARDRKLSADLDAYRRLRKHGLQPPSTDGCAELEKKANSQDEINWGRILTKEQQREARRRLNDMRDANES